MDEKGFRSFLETKRHSVEGIEASVVAVREFELYLNENQMDWPDADVVILEKYIGQLIDNGLNSEERLVAIARYGSYIGKNDFFIYIAGVVNGCEVPPAIGTRIAEKVDEETRSRVFEDLVLPPLGAPQEWYPLLMNTIMERMERVLPPEKCKEIMTWNYHGIPASAFEGHKERFEKAETIDEFLEGEHRRFIEEIDRFAKSGKVWYEQEIPQEFVEYARKDQELSLGKRVGDRIYSTKVPYDPKRFLAETDPTMKRYYACHCPLVRASIKNGSPRVSSTFCYCSAGFTKLPFDVIFGEPVEVELLESVLDGGSRCRFAIKIPAGKMK